MLAVIIIIISLFYALVLCLWWRCGLRWCGWCQVTATCCWLLLQEEEQGRVCVGLQFAVRLIVVIMSQHTDQ